MHAKQAPIDPVSGIQGAPQRVAVPNNHGVSEQLHSPTHQLTHFNTAQKTPLAPAPTMAQQAARSRILQRLQHPSSFLHSLHQRQFRPGLEVHQKYTQRLHHPTQGRMPGWLIVALIVPLLIIATMTSVGFALWNHFNAPHRYVHAVQTSTPPTSQPTTSPPQAQVSPTGTIVVTPTATPSLTNSLPLTPTPGKKPSPIPTSKPSPIATATLPQLGCISPTSITLGPVSEGFNGFSSQAITLCATGSGQLDWTASWDAASAPWLVLDSSSGQIEAPAQSQVGVNAYASKLKPGNYSTTITFTSQPGNRSLSLNINYIVQTGCVSATPNSLTFTGIAGTTNPLPQIVAVNNCGALGAWSTSVGTTDGANWLNIATSGGTLNSGAIITETATASNVFAKLPAGTYTGKITFNLGSASVIVTVTLLVQQLSPRSAQ